MADVFSKKKRSEIMSRIRSKNTSIEIAVFTHLRKNKIYFQRHYSRAAGKPDIALPRKKIAVFIDGDFWHGRHLKKTKDRLPTEYWKNKISLNLKRDKRNIQILKNSGWKILRIWQTDLEKNKEKTLKKITDFLTNFQKG